jgi:ubiquinone/menaquinone biosynthesis C-methylase UbiE
MVAAVGRAAGRAGARRGDRAPAWSRRALVRRYDVEVVGLDQSPQMLAAARGRASRARRRSPRGSRCVEGEAERLPFADGEFDHLTFTYLLRYVDDPAATLRELARVVAPGGRIASLEFGEPAREPWHALWSAYTRVGLPALGRLVCRRVGAGRALPRRRASPSSTRAIRSARWRPTGEAAGSPRCRRGR